jgi:8-oxo-dGTP pyrophosphatase MutT (NUDIX family)
MKLDFLDTKKEITPPIPASTVILIRGADRQLQVYLLQRSFRSGFFPGFYVFPGGKVEPEDRLPDPDRIIMDISLEQVRQQFDKGLDWPECSAYILATIRECFEETGILLAYPRETSTKTFERICSLRFNEGLNKNWLREKIIEAQWSLSVSRLAPWSHWITPEQMAQRFDTRFFIALMPAGQTCSPDNKEMIKGAWVTPDQGLKDNFDGKSPLSPPTLVTLQELLHYPDLSEIQQEFGSFSWGLPRLPKMLRLADTSLIIEPWDPAYGQNLNMDEKTLKTALLPVGTPFSRLWLSEGIWRPVKVG